MFGKYKIGQVAIKNLHKWIYYTENSKGQLKARRSVLHGEVDQQLAKVWTKKQFGNKSWTKAEVNAYRTKNKYTWHERNDGETLQLIPTTLNSKFLHFGGVGEIGLYPWSSSAWNDPRGN